MSRIVPEPKELRETIERMEARFADAPAWQAYERARQRFENDLADPRDIMLSRAAALMVLRFLDEMQARP